MLTPEELNKRAAKLHLAAKALENWSAVSQWQTNNAVSTVELSWDTGRLAPGYEAVRSRVEELVTAGMGPLVAQAVADIKVQTRDACDAAGVKVDL